MNSINFVTCHDGFTLKDLVSYNEKHNEANGEGNRDGTNQNFSYNYGAEGESDDPEIAQTRVRANEESRSHPVRFAGGAPFSSGEMRSKGPRAGTDNAFCQDNETSWYDWKLLRKNHEMFRFVREMISFRERNRVLQELKFYTDDDVTWFSPDGGRPDWERAGQSLAVAIHGTCELYVMFHADSDKRDFVLPSPPRGKRWHCAVDTSRPAPRDIYPAGSEEPINTRNTRGAYALPGRSMAILLAK